MGIETLETNAPLSIAEELKELSEPSSDWVDHMSLMELENELRWWQNELASYDEVAHKKSMANCTLVIARIKAKLEAKILN